MARKPHGILALCTIIGGAVGLALCKLFHAVEAIVVGLIAGLVGGLILDACVRRRAK